MTTRARARYAGYRFPAEIIGHAVWLCFRFPLGLRMVEELLAARGIIVSHETVQQWARKFETSRVAGLAGWRRFVGKPSM
jgi:putative transposase